MKHILVLFILMASISYGQGILVRPNVSENNPNVEGNHCSYVTFDGEGRCNEGHVIVSENKCCPSNLPFFCPNTNTCYVSCDEASKFCNSSLVKGADCGYVLFDGNGSCGEGYVLVSLSACCPDYLPYFCPGTSSCFRTCEEANYACSGSVVKGTATSFDNGVVPSSRDVHPSNTSSQNESEEINMRSELQGTHNIKPGIQSYNYESSHGKTERDVICFLEKKKFRCQNPQIEIEYTYNEEKNSNGFWYIALRTQERFFFPIDQVILHAWNENGPLADLRVRDAKGFAMWWHVVGPTIETGFFNLVLTENNSDTRGCRN
jgi:hypothetical protein